MLCLKPSASPGSCPEPHRLSFQEEEHRLGQGLRTHSCSEKVLLGCGGAQAGPRVTLWGLLGLAGGPHLRERGDAELAGALRGFLRGVAPGWLVLQPRLPAACREESTPELGPSAPSPAA